MPQTFSHRALVIAIFSVSLTCSLSLTAGCGGPTGPTPRPPAPTDPPRITCPAPPSIQAEIGQSATVTYAAPLVSGGSLPLSFKCAPPAMSSFDLGSTSVRCQVTDAEQRADSCTFTVTVVAKMPRISATTFVSFGDSVTEGLKLGIAPRLIPNPPGSYPANLQALLSARYAAQSIRVLDEGVGGEGVAAGIRRLPGVLASHRPDALLLLEGVNDLNALGASAIPFVVSGLRTMVQAARGRGVTVFLATLPPQREGASRAFAPTLIEPTNEQIRALAPAEGAVLVDLHRDFRGEVGLLLGEDGLHPNLEGYRRIADSFFAAIRATLEVGEGR